MHHKKTLAASVTLAAALLLSGCGLEADYTLDKDGNPTVTSYICMTKEEAVQNDISEETLAALETVTYNGKTYYKMDSSDSGSGDTDDALAEDYYDKYDGTSFYMLPDPDTTVSSTDESDSIDTSTACDFVIYNVQMADTIVLTNGEVSEDGMNVTFDDQNTISGTGIYAYTADSEDIIRIRELYDSKWSKTKTIHIDTVDKLKSVKVDGETVKAKTTDTGVSVKLTNGKHKVTVTTANAKKTFTVKVDSKKPTVSVQEKKNSYATSMFITFSDKGSGIKKATLNGKNVKSGTTVSKKGDYTLKVTDKAGNTKTVEFTIE